MKKTFEREYVWRRHGREGMFEGNMRKNMYGENVEERECLEKTFERGYVTRKHGGECMFWRKHGREGMFGETWVRGYVWRKHWREGMFGEKKRSNGDNMRQGVIMEKSS